MVTGANNKGKMTFAAVAGIIYLMFGILQLAVGLGFGSGLTDAMFIPEDFIGGFILLVIASVFLYGFRELRAGIDEGAAYLYVGILLALLFVAIYLLVMGADALGAHVIGSEDLEGWVPLDDMRPGIYLGILPFLGYLAWRSRFTLKGVSKAGV